MSKTQNAQHNIDASDLISAENFDEYDPRDDDLKELSELVVELSNENTLLKDRIMAKIKPSPSDGSIHAGEVIGCLQIEIKNLHKDIRVLTASRDFFMTRASENLQNYLYWKKRVKRIEKEIIKGQGNV
jgi:hypothetical protein